MEPSEANTRQKDQKFGILDSPSLLDGDIQAAYGRPLGVALIYLDVDGFKQVNTRFTETIVDQKILPVLQQSLVEWTGSLGHVYAEGGDEIVILLPRFTANMAAAFAEEIRQRVEALKFSVGNDSLGLTISLGVAAAIDANESMSIKQRANEAKKQAKLTGKNKVVTHAPASTSSIAVVSPARLDTCLLGEFDVHPIVYQSKRLLVCSIRVRAIQQLPRTVRVHAWRVVHVLVDGEKHPSSDRFNERVYDISQTGITRLGHDIEFHLTPDQVKRAQISISAQLQLEIIGTDPPPLHLSLEERYCRMTP